MAATISASVIKTMFYWMVMSVTDDTATATLVFLKPDYSKRPVASAVRLEVFVATFPQQQTFLTSGPFANAINS